MDVFQQKDADHYAKIASYLTGPGVWTGLFVPDWGKLFLSARAQQNAEILLYETIMMREGSESISWASL